MQDPIDRNAYFYFSEVTTRWMDNDVYGHVNNVTYYSYFDTIANKYLIEQGGLDIQNAELVGFVVASNCQYLAPIAYPEKIDLGFRVNTLGSKSVEYGIAIFKAGASQAIAHGCFTHVFVNRASGKSAVIPESIRQALELAII
jgi:acyl-CoA thioester hydrolase